MNEHNIIPIWIWGGKQFKNMHTKKHDRYVTLKSNLLERTWIKQFPIPEPRYFQMAIDRSEVNYDGPRIYSFYDEKENDFFWIDIFKQSKKFFFGTKHDFTFHELVIMKKQSEIGTIGVFKAT